MKFRILILILSVLCICMSVDAARIKDIVEIQGVRSNTVSGLGLVIGLNNTGDKTDPSKQMLASVLQRNSNVTFSPDQLQTGNIAQVWVTAELGPWDSKDSLIDINVAAIGDAKSLQGGQLMQTELRGADGEVYAVTRSVPISTASWTVEGKTGSKVSKNHPTVGVVPDAAHVEREEKSDFIQVIGGRRVITLNLHNSDFTTAERIRNAIEDVYPESVFVEGPGSVMIAVPETVTAINQVKFLDTIMLLDVKVDMPAVVVINERTGTIVVGGNVAISETAISQGSMVVKVSESQSVSQPTTPFTDGASTAVVDNTAISVGEEEGHLIVVPNVVTVTELAKALNAIGATPKDLIAIFNALKKAGALQARIEMM